MYLTFYGLSREPFHITPDPAFLFMSESHKQALASIIYCIEKRKGFVAITGGVGVGKTTIVRSYLESVHDRRLKIIYIFHANLSFLHLLKTVFRELGIKPETDDLYELVTRLQEALIEEFRTGNNVVLIVDEAQNMPVETLENLRMLSNLETTTEKLIQIVLIGQPEFDDLLDRKELRQLKQRIAIHARIGALNPVESVEYIKHRLTRAGQKDTSLFTKGALHAVVKKAEGIPRVINIICDNALVTGFGYQSKRITPAIVNEVIQDFDRKSAGSRIPLKWRYAGVAALIAFAVAFIASPLRDRVADALVDAIFAVQGQGRIAVQGQGRMIRGELQSAVQAAPHASAKAGQASSSGRVRVVKKGDSLSSLVTEVYGVKDGRDMERLVDIVKKNNPSIRDIHMIVVGTEIVFPNISRGVN